MLRDDVKQELIEVVAMSFETGHFSFEDYSDFKREYPNLGKEAWEYYCELVQMGPVGFYEEFKDVYDFDPMFVEEYGHYYDDDEDEEEYKFVVRFDIDGQNMDYWCEDKESAVEYAKKHLDCLPTIYKINEETGIEEFYMDMDGLEEEAD